MSAFLIDDSEDIEESIRGDGDTVPDGLDRNVGHHAHQPTDRKADR